MLKLFVFNYSDSETYGDAEHAAVAIAETEQEAIDNYRQALDISDDNFEVTEIEITNGLVLEALGYDSTSVRVHLTVRGHLRGDILIY